jgi:ectoine hydroxylase-related dioxygenase (phytanoyl-CoA dioxygenase family)
MTVSYHRPINSGNEINMLLQNLDENGFAVVPSFSDLQEVSTLRLALAEHIKDITYAGVRGIVHKSEVIHAFSCSKPVLDLIRNILGENARLVRSIIFNKTSNANWLVSWHQDLSIAVDKKVEIPKYSGWSLKSGVYHVQPPISVLENMITFRLHLDDTDDKNGALIVSPGTHKMGRLPANQVAEVAKKGTEHICSVSAGDVVLFRPLLIHSSKKATHPSSRRILHLEFFSDTLPHPLSWAVSG